MSHRNELIRAKRSEGVLGMILALAFISFAIDQEGWWAIADVVLAVFLVAIAVADFRRAHQIKRGDA